MNVKNGKLQLLLMTLCSPVFAQYSGRNTTVEELKFCHPQMKCGGTI